MANLCTNMFLCKTENIDNFKKIEKFIINTFIGDIINKDEESLYLEIEFYSKWEFPEFAFEKMLDTLSKDETLYMSISSHESGQNYASRRTYKNNTWSIEF